MESPLINYLQLFRPVPQEDKLLLTDAFRGGHICREMFFIVKGVLCILATNAKVRK